MTKKVNYVSLSNDLMSKYILGSKERIRYTIDLLVSLLGLANSEFKGAKVINSVKLNKERIWKKGFESDILLKTKDGTIYNIEVQNVDNKNSRVKNTMYVMRVFSGKIRRGEDYSKTKPVFQIVIMNDKDYKNRNNKFIEELVVCSKDSEGNYIDEYFKIFIVDINCEIDYTKIDKKVIGWVKLFKANSFKEAYEAEKYNEILKDVIRDMKEYMGEDYVQDYTIRDKLYRSDINSAREEGREEGRSEGANYANLITAQKLRDRDMDPNEIVEITGLPLHKVLSLKKREVSQVREEKAIYNQEKVNK